MTTVLAGEGAQDETLDRVVRAIVDGIAPSRLILFGSRARGTARPDSDYDLVVVWRDEQPPPFRAAAVRRCLRGIHASFDILVVTPSEFVRLARIPWHVVHEAEREGRALHAA